MPIVGTTLSFFSALYIFLLYSASLFHCTQHHFIGVTHTDTLGLTQTAYLGVSQTDFVVVDAPFHRLFFLGSIIASFVESSYLCLTNYRKR